MTKVDAVCENCDDHDKQARVFWGEISITQIGKEDIGRRCPVALCDDCKDEIGSTEWDISEWNQKPPKAFMATA